MRNNMNKFIELWKNYRKANNQSTVTLEDIYILDLESLNKDEIESGSSWRTTIIEWTPNKQSCLFTCININTNETVKILYSIVE